MLTFEDVLVAHVKQAFYDQWPPDAPRLSSTVHPDKEIVVIQTSCELACLVDFNFSNEILSQLVRSIHAGILTTFQGVHDIQHDYSVTIVVSYQPMEGCCDIRAHVHRNEGDTP